MNPNYYEIEVAELPEKPPERVKVKKYDFDNLFEQVKYNDCGICFKKIYEHYYNPLIFLAKKYVHSSVESEEVLSEVFLKIWNNRKEITIVTSFQNYLYTAVRNKALDFVRKNNIRRFETEDVANTLPSQNVLADDLIDSENLFNRIEEAIESLPEKRREIFRMSRTEGMKYGEIASKLGVSVKTVETQMGRSLRFLREKFAAELEAHLTC